MTVSGRDRPYQKMKKDDDSSSATSNEHVLFCDSHSITESICQKRVLWIRPNKLYFDTCVMPCLRQKRHLSLRSIFCMIHSFKLKTRTIKPGLPFRYNPNTCISIYRSNYTRIIIPLIAYPTPFASLVNISKLRFRKRRPCMGCSTR